MRVLFLASVLLLASCSRSSETAQNDHEWEIVQYNCNGDTINSWKTFIKPTWGGSGNICIQFNDRSRVYVRGSVTIE